uniref:Alpha/beta hydrolase n=1 Tax=uncultured bacterium 12-5D TaxID=1497524 RepID=A0A059U0Z7_9BACT|nr:alpha/beta hydrolase [uncultured bacterium 12-5D]
MEVEIRNQQGERLEHTFHQGGASPKATVVVGHGVTGNKDRPWDVGLCEALAANGFSALRFSFSGNGGSEGDFRESTVSKEVEDLGAVLDALVASGEGNLAYAGHSMGGAVGVIRASQDDRIKFLISLAGMVHTAKFAEVEFGDEKPDEGCMWEDPDCPLSSAFVNDMNAVGSVLDRVPRIRVPWLLVHGTADDVVPVEESREVFESAGEPKKLVELPEVDHVFSEAGLQPMIDAVTGWLGEVIR